MVSSLYRYTAKCAKLFPMAFYLSRILLIPLLLPITCLSISNLGMRSRYRKLLFMLSEPSGLPISGDEELAKVEFEVVGRAGDKNAIDIQGITGNSDIEPIESKGVDSEVTVI